VQRAAELLPVAREFDPGSEMRFALARILVRAGERDPAINELGALVGMTYLSPAWLRIDPNVVPLHGDPRFERLAGAAPPGS
jgi:hypothetical protein